MDMDTPRPLTDILDDTLESGDLHLGVFPGIAGGILKESEQDHPDKSRIIHLMTHDPCLTGTILHRANTAIFTGLRPTSNVYDALDRLGFEQVHALVLETIRIEKQTYSRNIRELHLKLWQHAVGTAVGAQWLSQRCGFHALMHEAFAAGLLHDIGKLMILNTLDRTGQNSKAYAGLGREVHIDFLEALHPGTGARLLRIWGVPEKLQELAAQHHQDFFDFDDSLAALVRLANLACHKLGIGLHPPQPFNLATTPEAYSLGLSEISLAELEITLEDSPLLKQRTA